jgi:hypothetical protein
MNQKDYSPGDHRYGFSNDASTADQYGNLWMNSINGTWIKQTTDNGIAILNAAGNFGIGTTSPFTRLSVAGNTYIGGNLTATGTLSIGTLNGLLFANAGVVNASTSLSFDSTNGQVIVGGQGLKGAIELQPASQAYNWYTISNDETGNNQGLHIKTGAYPSVTKDVFAVSPTGSTTIGGNISSYNGVSVLDVPTVVAKAHISATTTAPANLITYTVPSDGYYTIQVNVQVSAISTDTIRSFVHWIDPDSIGVWYYVCAAVSTSPNGCVSTITATAKGGTTITTGAELVVTGGTITYSASSIVTRLSSY